MRSRSSITLLLSSALALSALGCREQPQATAPVQAGAASEHAPTHAVPGSHEDWCGEHQVPESLCTRCNPSLVAAFKATGDWCAAHGLPKSQCRACDPKLELTRPPKRGP